MNTSKNGKTEPCVFFPSRRLGTREETDFDCEDGNPLAPSVSLGVFLFGSAVLVIGHISSNETDFGQECTSLKQFENEAKQFIIQQNDSSEMPLPDNSIDYVVTDPPYFDNVQYSDLSHYFRCCLHWFFPNHANWHYFVSSSAVAETKQTENKFGEVLTKIWQECNRVLTRPHGRLIFTYHHWRASAWLQLSISLSKAKFRLLNAYVVHSENPISVHIMNQKSLKHDAILVLKPEGYSDVKRWDKPKRTCLDNSYAFCKSCAQMLGWVLENYFPNKSIQHTWGEFLSV